ncbi:hypothetical protein A8H40_29680 [Burkholderia multivorans]|uniref:Uncharacterized protein n=2 Tax=Burkholderia multivorans TaxID=87883 RepID=B9BZ57_9BURK|nr:hypothetical protein A8H40_29680 [Burkholderia multivorans]EEE03905.1 hypothetical protein BURMUCGD2_3288 [Burkholderia multivorans CGD2]EEE12391.1 hypothetical protein BURMUCGD2M_0487 [Burkholderia multivorans CGD2M]EJO61960.1 hypothetical protein BURMUCF1_3082 [Burkholderia multivorans ATCC BAA-247]PRD82589.1 hypothetical protein C6P76_24655 [Burkholderia multivorans]
MRRSGNSREFTERKWGWQARPARLTAGGSTNRRPRNFEPVRFPARGALPYSTRTAAIPGRSGL